MVRAQEIVRHTGEVVRRKPREGDMRWDGDRWRRFNGRKWIVAAYSLHPERLRHPDRPDLAPTVPKDQGRRFLMRAVEDQVATNGATVVLDGEKGVILSYRGRTPHLLHLVLTILTLGLWFPLWVVASLIRNDYRLRLVVDDWGHVWSSRVAQG